MQTVTLFLDAYLCNGCGSCVEICPEVFRFDDLTGKATLITETHELTDKLQEAIVYCPEKCIILSGKD